MSDEPDNLTLVFLRRLETKMDRVLDDVKEVKQRMSGVELGLASVRREIAVLAETDAHLSVRVDKVIDRLDRIERRLDIVPPDLRTNARRMG